MADCKNCLHYAVCGYALNSKTIYECYFFTDKSRKIELPCKVGDIVYTTYHGSLSVYRVMKFTVNEFLWATLFNSDYSDEYKSCFVCLDFSLNEFVFLTREEAEQALKEREQK